MSVFLLIWIISTKLEKKNPTEFILFTVSVYIVVCNSLFTKQCKSIPLVQCTHTCITSVVLSQVDVLQSGYHHFYVFPSIRVNAFNKTFKSLETASTMKLSNNLKSAYTQEKIIRIFKNLNLVRFIRSMKRIFHIK